MAVHDVPRIGDSSAPRWVGRTTERMAPALAAVLLVGAVAFAVWLVAQWAARGDTVRLAATVVGLAIGLLLAVVALVAWMRHWAPLRRATTRVRVRFPGELVFGARVPSVDEGTSAENAPSRAVGPQRVVARVSGEGLSLYGVESDAPILERPWQLIGEIAVAEYAEDGKAYDGIALHLGDERQWLVLQPIQVLRMAATFPRAARLRSLVGEMEAWRVRPMSDSVR